MACYRCKNCGVLISERPDTINRLYFNFETTARSNDISGSAYCVVQEKCPECHFISVRVVGVSEDAEGIERWVVPPAVVRRFPEYVPAAIRADYEEACAVLQYSPKSAATLSRRCLEGILQDFFGIKEHTLYASLEKVKPQVSNSLWKAIDSLRRTGNIGAHMQRDVNTLVSVEPGEAALLLKLIERLIEGTYIARCDDDALFTAVSANC